MSIGAELGQYILQTHDLKKSEDSMVGWTPNARRGYRSETVHSF